MASDNDLRCMHACMPQPRSSTSPPPPPPMDWDTANRDAHVVFGEDWARAFGFDLDDDQISEVLGGYDHRTFPSDTRWRSLDDPKTIWRRAGLKVFDFKRPEREFLPDGNITLVRRALGYEVRMECTVERATRATRETIGEAIAPGRGRPVVSRNCGRAVLNLGKVLIRQTGGHRGGKRPSVREGRAPSDDID